MQRTIKFDFKNSTGQTLSGRLEMPFQKPRAFALFAHCFTCSKNILAATRIAKTLGQEGVAVLRFDFTGLGNSEGDFANTNFSSNVQDLVAAYEAIKAEYEAPQILIGHSLGGAAVLKTACEIEDVQCVVTIAAPSDVHHVSHLFKDDIDTIHSKGEADVDLSGRKFKIKKQFIEDISEQNLLEKLGQVKKKFLIFHGPHDQTVSIDHAAKIYGAVKHPKSFISLDKADHLITDSKDAEFVAQMIGSWVHREFPKEEKESPRPLDEVHVMSRENHKFTQDIYARSHHLISDEPKSVKGLDMGMTPYELLLAGLGSCTNMTMKLYAERKNIPLTSSRVELTHSKNYYEDCETCEDGPKKLDTINKKISLKGDLSSEQIEKLLEIAEKCPVNRTLQSEIVITKS